MSKKKSAAEPVEYIDSQAFDAAKEKIRAIMTRG